MLVLYFISNAPKKEVPERGRKQKGGLMNDDEK
jgi:hypothetical protein